MTDVIIIGAGPAGLTAAIYALRYGLSVLVFDRLFYGGQVALTNEVENYPAFDRITGFELSGKLYEQALRLGADIRMEEVLSAALDTEVKSVHTASGTYEAKTIIIANGVQRKKLGCEGEERLTGHGVSYCATCDGAFYKSKTVAVIGGGNTALEDALYLSDLCRQVILIHRRDTFRADQALIGSLEKAANISIRFRTTVEKILGENSVEALEIASPGQSERLPVDGVFIAIGLIPENQLYQPSLPLDEQGYFSVGEQCLTPLPGVFVAGDSRSKPLRQIITAAADGAVGRLPGVEFSPPLTGSAYTLF